MAFLGLLGVDDLAARRLGGQPQAGQRSNRKGGCLPLSLSPLLSLSLSLSLSYYLAFFYFLFIIIRRENLEDVGDFVLFGREKLSWLDSQTEC
jgi:hypothetical protein